MGSIPRSLLRGCLLQGRKVDFFLCAFAFITRICQRHYNTPSGVLMRFVRWLRIARTITVSLVNWPGFFERVQDSGGTATLVPPCLHTSLKLTYSSSGSGICQDQGSDLFVPSPQTQGKTGWNKRSGSTKRSREEHQSFTTCITLDPTKKRQ